MAVYLFLGEVQIPARMLMETMEAVVGYKVQERDNVVLNSDGTYFFEDLEAGRYTVVALSVAEDYQNNRETAVRNVVVSSIELTEGVTE